MLFAAARTLSGAAPRPGFSSASAWFIATNGRMRSSWTGFEFGLGPLLDGLREVVG
jgi:hypothetical protein